MRSKTNKLAAMLHHLSVRLGLLGPALTFDACYRLAPGPVLAEYQALDVMQQVHMNN